MRVKPSIRPLLEETLIAYYWAGFIMADGCVYKNRLKVVLGIKDLKHLQKLAKLLNTKVLCYKTYCALSLMRLKEMPLFTSKFDLKPNKTYNPPTLRFNEQDKLIAFFIGFIDGDGAINCQTNRTDCIIRVKVHATWLDILKLFSNSINNTSTPKLNNQGYANLTISNRKIVNFLKNKTIELKLPVLTRKWNKIDLDRKFKNTKEYWLSKIKKYDNLNLKRVELAKRLNISSAYITKLLGSNRKLRC